MVSDTFQNPCEPRLWIDLVQLGGLAQAASRLLADRKVGARVEEMHKLAEGQTLFAIEQALSEFEEARQLAMSKLPVKLVSSVNLS